LRRIALLAAAVAALACTSAASTALQPIRRAHARDTAPPVWKGPLRIPAEHFRGRIRVIARLELPPLAAAYNEGLAVGGTSRRLDVSTGSSRRYLARLERAQSAAVTAIRQAIPGAVVSRRFQVILDGVTVDLPVRRLTTPIFIPSPRSPVEVQNVSARMRCGLTFSDSL
jgi:hypothetical protein